MKTDLFQSCGHCWVFQICWHIECSTFTASSFRIWISSTGIPSLPLALFIVMLPKAHLTLHSRTSAPGEWSRHRTFVLASPKIARTLWQRHPYGRVCALCSVAQSGLTLCKTTGCHPPGSSAHGSFQARTLKWVAISYSRGSSWLRDQTCISCDSGISRQNFYH